MRFHTAVMAFFIVAGLSRAFAADGLDAEFVRTAAEGGRNQVAMAKMADQKATHQDTKMFVRHMIDDHSKMNDELTALAQKLNIALPDAQQDNKTLMDAMSGKSGLDFDRAFTNWAVEDHKKALAAFESEAKDGLDNEVKTFAAKYTEGLRGHLKMAQDLSDKLSKGAVLNDPEAEAAQITSVSTEEKAVEKAETVPLEPSPVQTATDVTSRSVNTGVDIATHPVETAKSAVTQPVDTAKNIVTAPFKSDRERREYSDYRRELRSRDDRSDFRDNGYSSENVRYERTYVEEPFECNSCVEHERCCGGFNEPVYDNDYKATETSLIEHHDDCDECR